MRMEARIRRIEQCVPALQMCKDCPNADPARATGRINPLVLFALPNSRAMGMCKRCGIGFMAEITDREDGMLDLDHFTPGWQDRRPPTFEHPPAKRE
jgi:hypothetical protein